MSKICIVGFHNLYLMQFLYKYTDILDNQNIEYDVIYWDRDKDSGIKNRFFNGNRIVFSYKMSNYQPKINKAIGFVKCLLFSHKKIRKGQYDKLILLTTQTILPMYFFGNILKKNSYIFDYRDLTYEYNPIIKKYIQRVITNSYFTAISSNGFKRVLGKNIKYVLSHNCNKLEQCKIEKKDSSRIRIVFWGMIRQVDFNKKVCDLFGNDSRFEVAYHGDGYFDELKSHCIEKGYKNIKITGRYMPDQIIDFVKDTDILMNLYENDGQQKLAMTVKLYDGIRYGLPMIITDGSYMAELMKDNNAVYCLNIGNVDKEDFVKWHSSLDHSQYFYKRELNDINIDDEAFQNKLLDFIRE